VVGCFGKSTSEIIENVPNSSRTNEVRLKLKEQPTLSKGVERRVKGPLTFHDLDKMVEYKESRKKNSPEDPASYETIGLQSYSIVRGPRKGKFVMKVRGVRDI